MADATEPPSPPMEPKSISVTMIRGSYPFPPPGDSAADEDKIADQILAMRNLDLGFNALTTMEEGLELMSNLETLALRNNAIPRIAGLDFMRKLQFLTLAYNKITRIEGVRHLPNLRLLDVSHNLIECAALDARELPASLTMLYLRGNPCMAENKDEGGEGGEGGEDAGGDGATTSSSNNSRAETLRLIADAAPQVQTVDDEDMSPDAPGDGGDGGKDGEEGDEKEGEERAEPRPWVCEYCGKAYLKYREAEAHERDVHGATGEADGPDGGGRVGGGGGSPARGGPTSSAGPIDSDVMSTWSSMVASAESTSREKMQTRLGELKNRSEERCVEAQGKHDAFMRSNANEEKEEGKGGEASSASRSGASMSVK